MKKRLEEIEEIAKEEIKDENSQYENDLYELYRLNCVDQYGNPINKDYLVS